MDFKDRTTEWIHKPKFSEVPESDRNQYYRGMLNDFRKEHKQFDAFLLELNELLKAEKNEGYSNIVKFIDGEAEWTWIVSEDSIFDVLIRLYNWCLSPLQAYEYIKESLGEYEEMLAEDYHSQIDFLNIGANPYDGKKDKIINIEIYTNKPSIFSKEETCFSSVTLEILTALRGIVVPTESNDILDAGNMKVFSYHHKVQEVLTLFEYHQNNKGLLKRVFLEAIKQLQEKGDIRLNSHRVENGKDYYDYQTDLNVFLR